MQKTNVQTGNDNLSDAAPFKDYVNQSVASESSCTEVSCPDRKPERSVLSSQSVAACMVRMLHHMGNIFRDNYAATGYRGLKLDKKRRKELQEWKISLGHREGDHEDPENYPKSTY